MANGMSGDAAHDGALDAALGLGGGGSRQKSAGAESRNDQSTHVSVPGRNTRIGWRTPAARVPQIGGTGTARKSAPDEAFVILARGCNSTSRDEGG